MVFLSDFRFYKFRVKCSHAEAGVVDDSRSAPIDVVADVKSERVRTGMNCLF